MVSRQYNDIDVEFANGAVTLVKGQPQAFLRPLKTRTPSNAVDHAITNWAAVHEEKQTKAYHPSQRTRRSFYNQVSVTGSVVADAS